MVRSRRPSQRRLHAESGSSVASVTPSTVADSHPGSRTSTSPRAAHVDRLRTGEQHGQHAARGRLARLEADADEAVDLRLRVAEGDGHRVREALTRGGAQGLVLGPDHPGR